MVQLCFNVVTYMRFQLKMQSSIDYVDGWIRFMSEAVRHDDNRIDVDFSVLAEEHGVLDQFQEFQSNCLREFLND